MYPIWPAAGIDRDYLFWIMRSQQFYSQAVACSTRTGLPKINRDGLSAISVLIPPLTEQKQIAALLNFWDKALNTLQKVVDVKREHKRALMQRLLTGKVRFPEFAGEPWFKLSADKIFKSHSKKGNTGEALLAVMQDIGVVPRDSLDRKVAMPEGDTHSYKLVEPGDFVISLRSFQGGIEYSMHRGIVSPAYTVLKSICSIEDAFYKHYFKSYDFIGHLAVAVIGIRDGKQVSYDDFSLLKLPYPSIEEQRKIAAVLSAADREINLLTQKLDAYKQQKKGLMQQLLTGKKRVNLENKEFA
jgi:type I restriction enzyme S subunit